MPDGGVSLIFRKFLLCCDLRLATNVAKKGHERVTLSELKGWMRWGGTVPSVVCIPGGAIQPILSGWPDVGLAAALGQLLGRPLWTSRSARPHHVRARPE